MLKNKFKLTSYCLLRLGCFQAWYPELHDHFKAAELSPYNNLWWNVHDFTPNPTGEGQNWSILGEMFKITDYMKSPENNEVKLSFDKSVVPLTYGNKIQNDTETTLIMVFQHEEQVEKVDKILEKMSRYPDKVQLAKTRYVTMDVRSLSSDFPEIFHVNIIIHFRFLMCKGFSTILLSENTLQMVHLLHCR